MTDFVPPAPDKARLLTPQWAVDKANELGRGIKEELLNSGAKIIGDVDSLGNSTVAIGHPTYPETIDIKTVAAAMLAFDQETIKKFPFKWLTKDLKSRAKKQIRARSSRLK